MITLGIDIGGSGIKAAVVDTVTGELKTKRFRVDTPLNPDREALLAILSSVVQHFNWNGPIGIGFPGVVRAGVIHTAANLGPALENWPLAAEFTQRSGLHCSLINDADAAGLAEVVLGAGRGKQGTIIMITVGTGIGTAVFHNGVLLPNAELGHLQFRGRDAELLVSERARKELDLSWKDWGRCFSGYLNYLEKLFWPDCFILGGGGVKKPAKVEPWLKLKTPYEFAGFGNKAGIVGAALNASLEAANRPQTDVKP